MSRRLVDLPNGLSARVANALRRSGFETAEEVLALPEIDLLALRGLGRTGLRELRETIGYPPERAHAPQAAWPKFRLVDGKPVTYTGEPFPEPLEYDLRRAVWTDESGEMLVGDTVYAWLTFPGYSGPAVLLT